MRNEGTDLRKSVRKSVRNFYNWLNINRYCGRRGIRTPGTLTRTAV